MVGDCSSRKNILPARQCGGIFCAAGHMAAAIWLLLSAKWPRPYGYCCRPNGCGRMASVLGHLADSSSHVAAAGQLHRGCAMWTAVHVDSCIVGVQCGQLSTWTVASSVCNVDSCPRGHLHRRCAMWTAVHVDSSMWTAVDSCPQRGRRLFGQNEDASACAMHRQNCAVSAGG